MFVAQVKKALDIFEQKFPGVCGIFLFDNAPSHKKYPPDALNPSNMNVYPGGKQAIMRDTVWNGEIQKNDIIGWDSQRNEDCTPGERSGC